MLRLARHLLVRLIKPACMRRKPEVELTPQQLESITRRTLGHYEQYAEDYQQGTKDHDVRQNIAALLHHLACPPPATILDFGCGPGRDLKTFTDLGHIAIGVDGASRFVAMAREYSGCTVWQQDFLHLELPTGQFDGIYANATLFHIPSQELPRILRQLHATLKPDGVLFSSIPRGANQEGWNGERYGTFYDLDHWRRYLTVAGFAELNHYYRPEGLPREQQPWLASVWQRLEARQELPEQRDTECEPLV